MYRSKNKELSEEENQNQASSFLYEIIFLYQNCFSGTKKKLQAETKTNICN